MFDATCIKAKGRKETKTNGKRRYIKISEWSSPIMVLPKKNGDVRTCSDFLLTVNKVLNVNQYPLPIVDDTFLELAGGKFYSVLDLSGIYQQLKVHSEFQKYLTINTFGHFSFHNGSNIVGNFKC